MPRVEQPAHRPGQPPRTTAVVDPPHGFTDQTRVVFTTSTFAQDNRGNHFEIQTVHREPLPNLKAAIARALDPITGGRDFHEELARKSQRELNQRILDPHWLSNVDVARFERAFPCELSDHRYLLECHIPALHYTGLIDNLGPETKFDPIGYLEETSVGRCYLKSIASDFCLHNLAHMIVTC